MDGSLMGHKRAGRHAQTDTHRYAATLPPRNHGDIKHTVYYENADVARQCQKEAWRLHRKRAGERAALEGTTASTRYGKINHTEQAFVRYAISKGVQPHRNGWPDFICETDNRIVGIEVKGRGDVLSAEQIQCFTMLEAANFTIYVWRRKNGLRPWRDDFEKQRGRALTTGALQSQPTTRGLHPQSAGQSEYGRPDGGEASSKVAVQPPSSGESSIDSPHGAGVAIKRGEPARAETLPV